jgi:hypothetical protein
MTRSFNRWVIMGVIIILAGGIALISWTAQTEDIRLREALLTEARLAGVGINAAQVMALHGSESDLASLDYQALKTQMTGFRDADSDIRFTYLISRRADGTNFFLVDSEPPGSEDYSPPGQEYPEVTVLIKKVFSTGRPV